MNKKKYLLIAALMYSNVLIAQNSSMNTPAAGIVSNDNFTYNGYTVSHYGLGWYAEPPISSPPLAYFSAFGGIKFFTQGQPKAILDGNGRLGIGTLTPISKLHVFGENANLWGLTLGFGTSNAIITTDDESKPISFQIAGYEAMRVNKDGHIGIGLGGPAASLHVAGGGAMVGTYATVNNTDGALSIGNVSSNYTPNTGNWTSTGSTLLLSAQDYSTIAFHDAGMRVDFIRSGAGTIQLGYDGGWGMANIGMPNGVWNSAGNVGIGTATPGAALTINKSNPTLELFDSNFNPGNGSMFGKLSFGSASTDRASIEASRVPGVGDDVSNLIFKTSYSSFIGGDGLNERMRVDYKGHVGIGSKDPYSPLQILKADTYADPLANATAVDNLVTLQVPYQNSPGNTNGAGYKWGMQWLGTNEYNHFSQKTAAIYAVSEDPGTGFNRAVGLAFHTSTFDSPNQEVMRISNDGNVGIGTATPHGYKLAVNGSIHTKAVVVDLNGFPDYVFNSGYKLRSLAEVKSYIDQNHHLPEMPSEKEVSANGLNLGEINKLLTKKVEELTLYLIEKDRREKAQDERIKKLEAQMAKLTAEH